MKRTILIFVFGGVLAIVSLAFAHPLMPSADLSERNLSDPHSEHHVQVRATQRGHGDAPVPFESLRMLSAGMTRSEVLAQVGPPRHTLRKSRVWVYSGIDKWIVELTFGGDRVIGVNWSRP